MNFPYFSFSVFSFILGVAFCSLWNLGFSFSIFLILLGSVLFLINKRDFSGGKSRYLSCSTRGLGLYLIFFLLFFGLGFLRCAVSEKILNKNVLQDYVEKDVSLIGVIVDEPDQRENNTKLVFEVTDFVEQNSSEEDEQDCNSLDCFTSSQRQRAEFPVTESEALSGRQVRKEKSATERRDGPEKISLKTRILLTVPHYPEYVYGDEIEVTGLLGIPKNFKTENGRTFDYVNYLAKDKIFYVMYSPQTKLLSKKNGNIIKEKLFQLKNSFLSKVQKTIPEPQVSLLGGLLLGAKQSLGAKLQEDFRKVGLIHIVVLSGYNVSIIADFMLAIFSFLPRMIALSFGALSIIAFAVMVGGSATIVRASIMALLVVLARATGRTSEVTRALFLAGFVMVLHNPQIVVFDPSFQLSFMATLGLIVLSPRINESFKFIPEKYHLRESVVATISTQIFVLPLLLFMMGELSLIAVFVNLLVLMSVPFAMLFGFFTGLFSYIWIGLSLPFAYVTHFLLSYELKVVEIFAQIPFASIKVPYFPLWLMLGIYILFFIFWIASSQVPREDE
ncbi:ComEC family competence protein [Patescibacteria group bacterium]|nr:ComEC family competence protein [Patescibacteria group bacterium]